MSVGNCVTQYECIVHSTLPYSGKFSYGANFRIFRMNALHAKIKTCEILNITS